MAASVIEQIRKSAIPDICLTSRVLHNRIDAFVMCYIKNLYRPLKWKDISAYVKKNHPIDHYKESMLYLANQSRTHIGRHAVERNATFFEALSEPTSHLIVIDNYMDISAKLLINQQLACCGFANWDILDMDSIGIAFDIYEYLTPKGYIENLETLLKFIRSVANAADIALVLYPSKVYGHHDRSSLLNSSMLNAYISSEKDWLMKKYDILIHEARDVTSRDLTHRSDWSHYKETYYSEIGETIVEWLSEKDRNFKPEESESFLRFSCKYTVGVVIQFYSDFDHIREVIAALAWVDEIIINDGPFEFTREILDSILPLGSDYVQRTQQYFYDLSLELGVNISYHYNNHADERRKRIYGYSKSQQDVILSIDADEILDIYPHSLDRFIKSAAKVGMFECVNVTYYGLCLSRPSPVSNENYPGKPFAFKRGEVSAEDHLDYLWLVGVKQSKKSSSDYMEAHICRGLHLTSLRSSSGAAMKFGFYAAIILREQEKSQREGPFARCLDYFSEASKIPKSLRANIMANSLAASVGLPENFAFSPYVERRSSSLARLFKEKTIAFKQNKLTDHDIRPLLPGIPCFIAIGQFETIELCVSESSSFQLIVHYYFIDVESDRAQYSCPQYHFNSEKDQMHSISVDMAESVLPAEVADLAANFNYIKLLQICCWGSKELESNIIRTGIPIYARLSIYTGSSTIKR